MYMQTFISNVQFIIWSIDQSHKRFRITLYHNYIHAFENWAYQLKYTTELKKMTTKGKQLWQRAYLLNCTNHPVNLCWVQILYTNICWWIEGNRVLFIVPLSTKSIVFSKSCKCKAIYVGRHYTSSLLSRYMSTVLCMHARSKEGTNRVHLVYYIDAVRFSVIFVVQCNSL